MNVLLLVDTRNIFNALRISGKLNYKAYIEKAAGTDHIYHAIAYGSQPVNKAHDFITVLEKLGFICRFTEGSGNNYPSPNVQITIDALKMCATGKIDRVILGSSDPDLVDLVTHLKETGSVSAIDIYASRIPKILKDAATNYSEIDESLLLEAKT